MGDRGWTRRNDQQESNRGSSLPEGEARVKSRERAAPDQHDPIVDGWKGGHGTIRLWTVVKHLRSCLSWAGWGAPLCCSGDGFVGR